jgi:predicted metal-binding protein
MSPGFVCLIASADINREGEMAVTLHVCITCRAGQTIPEGEPTPGARLRDAIIAAGVPDGVNLVPVECLSACSQGCSVALSAPGRWAYVYGRLSQDNARDVVAGAAAYAAAPDGLVPWRSRPEIFRKQSLARIPPVIALPEAAE